MREHTELGESAREQGLVGGDHGFAGGECGTDGGLDGEPAGDLDDDVDLRIGDELERRGRARDVGGIGGARLLEIANGDLGDAEANAVALGHRTGLRGEHRQYAATDGATPDHADPDLAQRTGADTFEPRPWRGGGERARVAQQGGELVLIGEERVVAVLGVELPQRALRADGLELAIQLVLEGVGEQQIAGHADDQHVGGDAGERRTHVGGLDGESTAIDRLAEQQERANRELRGEPLAVMIEVGGDGWMRELRHEHAEPRVELVASAIGEHPELPRARHAGRDVAGAQTIAYELALEMAGGGPPAVGTQTGGDRDQSGAPLGMARRERDADEPAEAGTDERRRNLAADALEPRGDQVGEAERGQLRNRTFVQSLPGRSVAGPARRQHGHRVRIDQVGCAQRRPPRVGLGRRVAERKRRGGDTADHDHDRCTAIERAAEHVARQRDVLEPMALDVDRLAPDRELVGPAGGGRRSGDRQGSG